MKTKMRLMGRMGLMLVAALGLMATMPAMAQQNTNGPTTPQQVLANIGSYFSSFNTNLTWTNTPMTIWTGANYQSGVNTSEELGASYDLWRPTADTAIAPEAVVRNAIALGSVTSAQAGAGASLFHWDLKVTGYIDAGDNLALGSPFIELGGRLEKKITVSTYAGCGLSFVHLFKGPTQNTPTVTLHVGWAF